MVDLPQFRDETLEACDRALEDRYNNERTERPYLGMSGVGAECARQLWYRFRWIADERYDARSIKRFDDGHRTEELAVSRLQELGTLIVRPVDPTTGKQFEFKDFGGHFLGHSDGDISGLIEAPKTPHVLEIKCVSEESFAKLEELIALQGEKSALRHWNATYYGQAQLYMLYGAFTRHFLVVLTPGGRRWTSVRTEFDKTTAMALRSRAEHIIFSERPPERLCSGPDFYQARWCPFSDVCFHDAALAKRSCRSCTHATPERDGTWSCVSAHARDSGRGKLTSTVEGQRMGCEDHRFHPLLLWDRELEAVEGGRVIYRSPDGESKWIDEGPSNE